MAKCKNIQKQKKILCLGALNKTIEIETRALTPDDSSTDFTETFTAVKTVKAMIETNVKGVFTGVNSFNGTNISDGATHLFTIKYSSTFTITAQSWIKYKGLYFDIIDVENVDEEDNFLKLRSARRGDETVKANWA